MTNILSGLRREKNKLLRIARQQRKVRKEILQKRREEEILKAQIKRLKTETGKSLINKLKRLSKDPRTRVKAERIKKKAKSFWNKFQKFADKYGD